MTDRVLRGEIKSAWRWLGALSVRQTVWIGLLLGLLTVVVTGLAELFGMGVKWLLR